MKILVTGATGLLGSHLVRHLLAQGYQVRAIRRRTSDTSLLEDVDGSIEWVEADVLDITMLSKSFEGIGHVVHCAAKVSFHKQDEQSMRQTNIVGTINVVNMCLENNIEKLVYVSSVAALGRNGKKIIDETAKWETSSLNSVYAETKYESELQVWRAAEEGLKVAIVNPSVIIGLGDWNGASMQLFQYVLDEKKFYPSGDINYVDVRDVVHAISLLLFNNISEERIILNASNVSFKHFFGLIAKHLGKKAPSIRANNQLVTFAYIADTLRAFITGKRPIITRDSIRLSKMDFVFNNKKAEEQLKMHFKPLEETVLWTCAAILKDLKK